MKKILALDADGVLLDYNRAYAGVWQQVFGADPKEKDPHAYWALDRWDVERLNGDRLIRFRTKFDEGFWESVPAMPGAVDACLKLYDAGFSLVCVSALSERFAPARLRNLHQLGFPIEAVIATGELMVGKSPKADALHDLSPLAFVDDYLPYMEGVHSRIHTALILRDPNGSPNTGDALQNISSTHGNLPEFSDWWLEHRASS